MPFEPVDKYGQPFKPDIKAEEQDVVRPAMSSTLEANFRDGASFVPSLLEEVGERFTVDDTLDQDFDPYEHPVLKQMNFNEEELDEFLDVRNKDQFHSTFNRLVKRRQRRDVIAESSLGGNVLAGLAGGITDPLNLLPIGTGLKAGQGVARTAATTALTAVPAIGLSEAIIRASQPGATTEEAITNTLVGAAFTGMFAGAVKGVATGIDVGKEIRKIKANKANNNFGRAPRNMYEAGEIFDDQSVGAAMANRATLDDLGFADAPNIISDAMFKVGAKSVKQLYPIHRLFNSSNRRIREISNDLIENPLKLKGQATGEVVSQAVETLKGLSDRDFADGLLFNKDQYKAYRARAKAEGIKPLSQTQFDEEISKAMRRGDASEIPEIQATAQKYRKLNDDFLKEMQELKMLPDDVEVKYADSYVSRMPIKEKIVANEPDWRFLVKEHAKTMFNEQVEAAQAAIARGGKGTEDAQEALATRLSPEAREDYLEEVADWITDQYKGIDVQKQIPGVKMAKRGLLKDRTFNMPDTFSARTADGRLVTFEDFLENNIKTIMERQIRVLRPDIELQRKFGTTKFADLKEDILIEHRELIKNETDPKVLKKLNDQLQSDLTDLDSIWDLIRGTYNMPTSKVGEGWRRSAQMIRHINMMRLMGQVLLASFPDFASTLRGGFQRTFSKGFKPIAQSLKASKRKLTVKHIKQLSLGTEHVLANRIGVTYELGDMYARGNMFERLTRNMSSKFGNLTGANYWNDLFKSVSGLTTESRIYDNLDTIKSGKKLSAKEEEYMNFLGIGETERRQISQQLEEFGETIDDTFIPNTDKWTNDSAKRALQAAVRKQANIHVVTPGVGDRPLIAQSEIGKVIAQFRGFALASHNRLLLAGLQQGDFAAYTGALTQLILGTMVYYIRTPADRLSDDPMDWFIEGADRSGVFALPFIFHSVYDNYKYGGPEAATLKALGPSGGLAADSIKLGANLAKGRFTEKDINRIRKMIPYQNHIFFKKLFDLVEEEAK